MDFLTLQLALSSLSFLYNSPTFLPQIESLPAFETSWKGNLDLALAMSKDNRIAITLEAPKWARLQDVSSYVDRNNVPLLFSVIEEILRVPTVERIVEVYPEYQFALLTTSQLAVSITEFYKPPDMNPDNWRQLLALTRMENTLAVGMNVAEDRKTPTVSLNSIANTEKNMNGKEQCLEEDTALTDFQNCARNQVPTTVENAIHFLQVGFYFKLPFLANRSSKFLEKELSMDNVVRIYQAASDTKRQDLKENAADYILLEFEEISKKDQNFTSLKIGELFSLLMSEKLNIRNEELIFQAIVRWVQADPKNRVDHITTLMKAVRLHLCSLSLLNMIIEHHLLENFQEIRNSIRLTINLIKLDSPKLPDLIKKEQRYFQKETLFVIGGFATGLSTLTLETFSNAKQEWIYNERFNNGSTTFTSAAAVGKTILVFVHDGQFDGKSFDLIKKEWKSLPKMITNRYYFSLAVLNDLMYAVGGEISPNNPSNACESYDAKTGVWTKISNLNTARNRAGAATLQGKVYLAGGYGPGHAIGTVEMYDPETNLWTYVTPLNSPPRWALALGTDGNYLYSFGGHTGGAGINNVEKYDPESGVWTVLPETIIPRVHSIAEYYLGSFYVMGGGTAGAHYKTVQIYNPRNKTWRQAPEMNIPRYYPGSCVIKDLPNAADYMVHETL